MQTPTKERALPPGDMQLLHDEVQKWIASPSAQHEDGGLRYHFHRDLGKRALTLCYDHFAQCYWLVLTSTRAQRPKHRLLCQASIETLSASRPQEASAGVAQRVRYPYGRGHGPKTWTAKPGCHWKRVLFPPPRLAFRLPSLFRMFLR